MPMQVRDCNPNAKITWRTSAQNLKSLASAILGDILGGTKNLTGSRDHNHAHFMDGLSSVGWD